MSAAPKTCASSKISALAIARCNALGIPVVIVTNQSGIGRGYYDWNGFHAVQAALSPALSAAGAHFDAVLACAYHGEAREPLRIDDHPWRKPNPECFSPPRATVNFDLSRSWIVGDRSGDLAAGAAAGLPGGTLLPRDENERREALGLASVRFVVRFAVDLAEAVATLLERGIRAASALLRGYARACSGYRRCRVHRISSGPAPRCRRLERARHRQSQRLLHPRLKQARLAELRNSANFRFERCDVADRDAMAKLFAAGRFTYVAHLAAQAGVRTRPSIQPLTSIRTWWGLATFWKAAVTRRSGISFMRLRPRSMAPTSECRCAPPTGSTSR